MEEYRMDNYREKTKRTLVSAKVSEDESEVLEEIRKLSQDVTKYQDIRRNLMENRGIMDEVMAQVNELKSIDNIIQENNFSGKTADELKSSISKIQAILMQRNRQFYDFELALSKQIELLDNHIMEMNNAIRTLKNSL